GQRGRPHPERLSADPPGVGQRPEHIEDRAYPELLSGGTGVPHRGMEGRRETEAHPGDVDAPSHAGGIESDVDAERLEHVGAASPAITWSITVRACSLLSGVPCRSCSIASVAVTAWGTGTPRGSPSPAAPAASDSRLKNRPPGSGPFGHPLARHSESGRRSRPCWHSSNRSPA